MPDNSACVVAHRNTRVLVADTPATSFLLSDAAPVDALYLVYHAPWRDALVPLLVGATPAVRLVVPAQQAAEAAAWLVDLHLAVPTVAVPLDSPWIRDYAPLQRGDGVHAPVWVDPLYHESRPHDDAAPSALAHTLARTVERAPFFLEGGGIMGNGRGLCAVTWSTFAALRLPLHDAGWEARLALLGCAALAIVPPPSLEATGHIDMLAQFTAPDAVVLSAACEHADEGDRKNLAEAAVALQRAAEVLGQRLRVWSVPMHADGNSGRYYSYINAVRLAGVWFVPDYAAVPAAEQTAAYQAMAAAAPDAVLTPVPANPFIQLGGALHCISWGLAATPRRP